MRYNRIGRLAVPLAGLLAAITACSSASSTQDAASHGNSGPLAYSQCMRAHGIKDFPDPNANGGLTANGAPGGDLDPSNPKYQTANTACQSLMNSGMSQAQQQTQYRQGLKYARCLRQHGIANFPDPQPPGSAPQSQSNSSGSGQGGPQIDTNSPQFVAANRACGKYLGGNGPSSNSGGSSS